MVTSYILAGLVWMGLLVAFLSCVLSVMIYWELYIAWTDKRPVPLLVQLTVAAAALPVINVVVVVVVLFFIGVKNLKEHSDRKFNQIKKPR